MRFWLGTPDGKGLQDLPLRCIRYSVRSMGKEKQMHTRSLGSGETRKRSRCTKYVSGICSNGRSMNFDAHPLTPIQSGQRQAA